MPKYWVKNYFAHGRFPEVGQKQKTEKKRRREKEEERLNDGDNNGQATHGARKHAWRTQAAWAKKEEREKERKTEQWPSYAWCTQARMADASRLGQFESFFYKS